MTASRDPSGAAPTKEEVYDAEISPLMTQVIAICKRAGIPVHASFALDGGLACTTHVAPKHSDVPQEDLQGFDDWAANYDRVASRAAGNERSPLMLTTRDKDGNVTRVEAIL